MSDTAVCQEPERSALVDGGSRELVNPVSGELVLASDIESLAPAMAAVEDAEQRLKDFKGELKDAILTFLDANTDWTWRVEGLEVTADSPTAGAEGYPPDELERVLREKVKDGTLTERGAGKALKRQLILTLGVPLMVDLGPLPDAACELEIRVGGVVLQVLSASPKVEPAKSGINAVRKVDSVREALDGIMVRQSPNRKLKVTVV